MYNLNTNYCVYFVVLQGKPQRTIKIYFRNLKETGKEQRGNKTTVLSYGHIRSLGGTNWQQMPIRVVQVARGYFLLMSTWLC